MSCHVHAVYLCDFIHGGDKEDRLLRERGRMSKSVYVRVVHNLELLRYVLRCAIERQL